MRIEEGIRRNQGPLLRIFRLWRELIEASSGVFESDRASVGLRRQSHGCL